MFNQRVILLLIRRRILLKRLMLDNVERKRRRWFVRPIFTERSRRLFGDYNNLVQELRMTDPGKHFNYLRMTADVFDELLELVQPHIYKESVGRNALPPGLRLALTLRYLASGDSMVSMSYDYRVGISTVSGIIKETCNAIWSILSPIVLNVPDGDRWREITNDFNKKWNFPNCLGSIDGKHVIIQAPENSGSVFYNYKHSYSLVLMAICDANYLLTFVDIGAAGRQSDGGIFQQCTFGNAILNDTLPVHECTTLLGSDIAVPQVFIGDEAFPLRKNLMRPYPGRNQGLSAEKTIYNYRLSRARRLIENTFGIMAARFRIFRRPILATTETVESIIKGTVCLHNWLQKKSNDQRGPHRLYCPPRFFDREVDGILQPGLWRDFDNSGLQEVRRTSSNNYPQTAENVRAEFARYFMSEGQVPWQWKLVHNN